MNIFIYLSIINAVKSFSNIAPKLKPSLLNIVCRADLRIRRRLNGLPGEDPGPQLTSQPDPQLYLEATTRSAVPQIVFLTWKFFFHLFSKQTWVLFYIWALTCGLDVIFYRLPKFFSSLLIKTNAVNFTFLAQNVNKKLPAWYFVDHVVAFLFINFFLLTTIEICLKVTRKFIYFGATVM